MSWADPDLFASLSQKDLFCSQSRPLSTGSLFMPHIMTMLIILAGMLWEWEGIIKTHMRI